MVANFTLNFSFSKFNFSLDIFEHIMCSKISRLKLNEEYYRPAFDDKLEYLFGTIYPTPPLGQDMTQGQFLSGV